ncbi:MAG: DUF499 domain-containing protein, partial [Thermoanaerobaculum sp.]|nr:DUF499 domain-containing protein [Thermoanaerobaculum sp.]
MASRGTKRVWEVCEPHPDVFARDPDPSLFAISLHHVEQGTANRDYTEPERFFQKTFMTASLQRLLEGVLARLVGVEGRGAPILRLETPFGGGKTHTMTALFHLARHPEAAQEQEAIQPILEHLNLRTIPRHINVAVLDGRGLDVRERSTGEGVAIRTLWGELAYRLGGKEGYEAVADADRERLAPGSQRLTELLGRYQPFVILMDEVLEYLVKARAVKVGDSNLMEQTGTFLGSLTAAVSACPQGVLVAALPASSLEVPAESSEAAERLFQHARKVLGRMELVETPVTQDEVFGVLRRRLFGGLGNERDHKKAVEALQEYYGEYARFFPDQLRSPEYKQRMLAAYPFHPALIDLLYERWGPHPQFQRTRGALRLLALLLRRLWNQRPASALLIQPHHLDLLDRHIRGEVVRLLDSGFDTIITGDILQRAGEIERGLGGEYAREQLGKGAATCALLYSVSAGARDLGATEEEIRTALLRPDTNPAMLAEVLGRLRDGLWYLRYRDRRYYFTARPNLNKVILDHEEELARDVELLTREFHRWLERVAGRGDGGFLTVVAPTEPAAVPDQPRPTLVVLSPELSDEGAWMKQAAHYAGGSIRRHKNMLVFLAGRQDSQGAIQAALRRWLALQQVTHSASFKELDSEDKEQVKAQLKDKEAELEALLFRTYTRLYRPSSDGVEEVSLRQPPESFKAKTLAQFVEAVLRQEGIFLDRIDPEFLKNSLGPSLERQDGVPLSQVESLLTGVPGLPMVKEPQEALIQAIREGVQQGMFALRSGEKVYCHENVPLEELSKPHVVLLPPTAPPPPPPPPPPESLKLRVHTRTGMLYPLLKAAEKLLKVQGTVVLEVRDQGGELARLRDELDKLLNDYGCTVEWLVEGS